MEQQKTTLLHQWNSCCLDRCGSVYILTLIGEGHHLFNPSSLNDIVVALTVVEQSPDAGALVTTNEGRYFSNGFDFKCIVSNRSLSLVLVEKLEGVLSFMMKLGIPTIAAVYGHASAGGFVFALAHDYRFITSERVVLYMSELDHGMIIPSSITCISKSKLMPSICREVVLKAKKFTASEAVELGVVDGIYDDSAKTVEADVAEGEKLARRKWKRENYAALGCVCATGGFRIQ